MGFGKTSAMINFINREGDGKHFVFVTPYLDELGRIKSGCKTREFFTPEAYDDPEHPTDHPRSKMIDFKRYLKEKKDIVTTHALFQKCDAETVRLILEGGYTLIMDEVADVISRYDISPYDARMLNERYCNVDEDGRLVWKEEEKAYYGDLLDRKIACDSGVLWYYNKGTLVSVFPISAFKAFDDVYIMTYLFEAQMQRAYFDIFGLKYNYLYVTGNSLETYTITSEPQQYKMPWLKDKIHICAHKKMNRIGDATHALSKTWHEKHVEEPEMTELRNLCRNFLVYDCKASSKDAMFTTFKNPELESKEGSTKPYYSPKGYSSSFVPCNARATNQYRNRWALAYPLNRYVDIGVRNFLTKHNTNVDNDMWALSEMIQWIWRSRIRDGKDIWIYIPSERMRNILVNWINEMTDTRKEEDKPA